MSVALALVAVAACLFGWRPAMAQGFMVKPMRMDIEAPAGRTIDVPLEIRNTAGSEIRAIDVRLAEMSQHLDGGWRLIEEDSGEDTSQLFSSLPWSTLSHTKVDIAPMEPAEVMLRLNVPANARGAYFAAIVAEAPMPEGSGGVAVRVRFVIPVIIQIAGRPVRQQVNLTDVLMSYHDGSDGKPATTNAALRVTNEGRTFSRVKGQLTLERRNGEAWRLVTRSDLKERPIIPGVTLELGQDLERRLPSGEYRLRANLHVDGRRVAPLEKEIAFEGDPNADRLAYDTPLLLKPDVVDMDIRPGATRTTTLLVENPSNDPVKVRVAAATPPELVGVALGEIMGIALSAEPWTQIRPPEFTLRPNGRQNIQVVSRVPGEDVHFPHYYADLTLSGTYPDGQSAGHTRSKVHLANKGLIAVVNGKIEQVSLAEGDEPTEFFAQLRFSNLGNVHLEPKARFFLLTAQGRQIRNVGLSGDEGILLPLSTRSYGGRIEMKGIEPGYYALRAVVDIADDKRITDQKIVRVEAKDGDDKAGGLTVTLIEPEAENVPEEMKTVMGDGPVVPLDGATAASTSDAK